MSRKPIILDMFCGAGGAAVGYARAGFEVVGIDIAPQPHYPFTFHQGDAIELAPKLAEYYGADAVHGSPPCQRYSLMSQCRPALAARYPDLLAGTRDVLESIGLPYVIENVPGAPMRADVTLCGFMFGRELIRHRLFESTVALVQPRHVDHGMPASKAGHWVPGTVMSVSGHIAPIAHARAIMGIDWTTRAELAEAIPPAYTEYVGAQLIREIGT